MKILITGASGLIGKHLLRDLQLKGHDVYALVRSRNSISEIASEKIFSWQQPHLEKDIAGINAVIHLSGEGVADKPWTKKRKKQLRESRLKTTSVLIQILEKIPSEQRPSVLISASAIGFYGEDANQKFDEHSPQGKGFLAELCADWENESKKAIRLGLRHVNIRLGLVLSKEGGFLSKMGPFILGNGKQWMSWIHIDDVTGAIQQILQDSRFEGPVNLVSPNPIQAEALTKIFARQMGFPFTLKVPSFILKVVLGEMATTVIGSQKVLPEKLQKYDYPFVEPEFKQALGEIFKKNNFLDSYHVVSQFIAAPRTKIFDFFSTAENLETITPPWLNFKISKKSSAKMGKDLLIDYRLKIRGIPVKWKTLISEWTPENHFIDEQIKGPYTKWHHQHRFDEVLQGTLIRDEVTFRVPGGWIGKLVLTPWIRKDVSTIFEFRKKKIVDFF